MQNKQSRTIKEQIDLLKERGMFVNNEQEAAFYLNHISYYRLKGYWWDMQDDYKKHIFRDNASFDDIIRRYNFDKELRIILFDAIETIEIALRTKMIYHISQAHGGLWYLDNKIFDNKKRHEDNISNLEAEFSRSKEVFANEYKKKHPSTNPTRKTWESNEKPDAWIIFEVSSLGTLSKIYKNLKHQLPEKTIIAKEMGLNLHSELSSWLEAISYLRNIIAHHSRIWRRSMSKTPIIPATKLPFNWIENPLEEVQTKKAFYLITTILYLCNAINPNNKLKSRLIELFNIYPNIGIYKIGFINNWDCEPIWKSNHNI
ncbi:MAG: Abi family protein [Bacteroidales bacterium]